MFPLQRDLLSVTSDQETAKIRLLILMQHSAAITLQPPKLRHPVCPSKFWRDHEV